VPSRSTSQLKIMTPLLMPPPSTRASAFKHRVSLYKHYLISWITLNQQTLYLLLRLTIFFVKVASLTYPCSPVMPKQLIWWPVVGLAALELSLGGKVGWSVMGVLASVHVIVLAGVFGFGRGLCDQVWERTW
jgi:hypothetical protein